MKRTVIAILLLLPALAFGQRTPGTGDDTSATVVDRYLQLMNFEGYSTDSIASSCGTRAPSSKG